MRSPIVKRSVVLAGRNTSVSLEDAFWQGLKDIATSRRTTLSDLISSIDGDRERGNLSSALRLFVLSHYQAAQRDLGSERWPVSKRINSSITRR
jgi:predicted DNA-binding ribbon-helix-helix protein